MVLVTGVTSLGAAPVFSEWKRFPATWKGASEVEGKATLTADTWSFLVAPVDHAPFEISANVTVLDAAKQVRFFGEGWSAWPDSTFGDGGFDAGFIVHGSKDLNTGYRVQLSRKHQCVALVSYPEGGYLRVVPCEVKLKQPHAVLVASSGNTIRVKVDGQERILYVAREVLKPGTIAIGTSSGAKVEYSNVAVAKLGDSKKAIIPAPKPNFSVRKWLGDRQWIFDGDEPILQLHYEKDPSMFAKLRPELKPQLTFDSHWGLENQGAFKEAASTWTAPTVTGGGESIEARWSAKHVKDRFMTKSTLIVGFDSDRGTYTYDIESELEVLPGEPFHFRYGFDFEHHTPLDPFGWQYLIAKRRSGELYHRPVYPIDPGPQSDLESYHGARVWYGRHHGAVPVVPAVEYEIRPEWHRDPRDEKKTVTRKLNTAICAAFYDTGVSFEPETSVPGTKLRVKYRYTGYPTEEARKLFEQSKVYDSPTLDPNHYYIFADEWPKLTFSQFERMSKSWIYGRTPFMTGHNMRPTYELERNCGVGSGFAMKLGPASFGKANLPVRKAGVSNDKPEAVGLDKGRWLVTARVKSINAHGPGGRIEVEAIEARTNKVLAAAKHFVGNGTFDWKPTGFVLDVPNDAAALSVAFGNAGTGEMLITEVEFKLLRDGEQPPQGIAAPKPIPDYGSAPAGAFADFRMLEGKGHFVFNYAKDSPLGHLDLANLEWVTDSGRPALRFADNTTKRSDYRRDSRLSRNYLNHPSYADKSTLPLALTGHHGGGTPLKGVTLAAWIKPAAKMGNGSHGGKGDIIGFGARRFILGLHGAKAPYWLAARINVNDVFECPTKIEADKWVHVAMTAAPKGGQWHVRVYLNGKEVGEGQTKKFSSDSAIVPSLILGAELFYFHDAYYRGLIGHTLAFERALGADEIAKLALP
jgi:hypothetical protein